MYFQPILGVGGISRDIGVYIYILLIIIIIYMVNHDRFTEGLQGLRRYVVNPGYTIDIIQDSITW